MSFTSDPSWALPLAYLLIALLLACLVGFMVLPLHRSTISRRQGDRFLDPHAEPFGDQPELPGDRTGRPS